MKLNRGLLVAASAVGLAYLMKTVLQKDIDRYNNIAEMSGDKPLVADQLDKLKTFVGAGGRNGST